MESLRKYDIGVVGLGYVGLTVSAAMAEVGLKVIGVEKRREIVDLTNNGKPHFVETGLSEILGRVVRAQKLIAANRFSQELYCDTYMITVGTPLDSQRRVRLDMI